MTKTKAVELQVDRLVGPTHTYGGLSYGNIASMQSESTPSNPLAAFIEGLEKMRFVANQGVPQAILPPQLRPRLDFLDRLGFKKASLEEVASKNPLLLRAIFSSSAMWMANSATIAPSADSSDKKVHITPANLLYYPHRSLETEETAKDLKVLFPEVQGFIHHAPLPSSVAFSDEGAANHTLFTEEPGKPGVHLFVFGRSFYERQTIRRFPARQTKEASEAIARLHTLRSENVLCLQQSKKAIEAGIFHNDVISVGHESLFIYHEQAFADGESAINCLKKMAREAKIPLQCIQVTQDQLSLEEAAKSYLFNMQILRTLEGQRILLVSQEAVELPRSYAVLEAVKAAVPDIAAIHVTPLRQSMQNGGGPACLRLRVVLTQEELSRVHSYALWTPEKHDQLIDCAKRHYRTVLDCKDLLDPKLTQEALQAHQEICKILDWKRE